MSLREILYPATWAYQIATGVRNWLYDHSWIRARTVDAKVISVGNLTMGGTGKTPVTIEILRILKEKGFKCGVVSRGYGREKKGVLEVDVSVKAAHVFGDEPALIKASFPDSPVVVGEKRVDAVRALLARQPVDFVLCDDAFQHRRLHRDLNLLLIDATEPQRNYRVVPVGRARESHVPAMQRADFLIVTKANLVNRDELKATVDWLESRANKPVIIADYVFKGFRSLATGKVEERLKDSIYLVSGVAKPEAVERTLEHHAKIVKHRTFSDHHRYVSLEIEEMLDEASSLQARWLVTTPKDGTKLGAFSKLRERLWIAELGIEFKGEVKAFYEAIDRLARPSH